MFEQVTQRERQAGLDEPRGTRVSQAVPRRAVGHRLAGWCGLALAAGVLLLAGTSCHVSRSRTIGLEWNNAFTWDDRFSPTKLPTTQLPPDQVETIKRAAMEALRTAFPPDTGVRLDGTTRVTDRIAVLHIDRAILGESMVCGAWLCPPSRVNYDLHMTLAQEYAKDRGITDRAEILRAIGRGIGFTAAHEFGHRHRLAGMHRTPDKRALTAGGIDVTLFYGPPLYWPERTLKDMRERFSDAR